jgi:glycosyltransferase involved in cell wall biosynthesis
MTGPLDANGIVSNDVIMVAAGELFAGAERQILALLVRLRADGYRPTLAVFHDRELARHARELGLDVAVLPGTGVLQAPAIKRIAALVRSRRAPIVHFHGYKAALHVALTRRTTPFESVVTVHGAPEFGGPLSARLRSFIYDRCEQLAIQSTRARVVFVTRELAKKLPERAGKRPYDVIPNGIDPQTVANLARPVELSPAHFNVVVVGRLDTIKGITFAIDAMRDPRIPPTVRLCIVGDGPERTLLREQAGTSGLDGRVGFTGFRSDAAAFVAHADLLLMPSLHEGLPYTMLEAIASATPIAASRVGGLAETLEDRRTAFLFPVADVAAIAAAIVAAASDPVLGKSIGRCAQTELLPRFDASIMARGYEAIYTAVTPRRSVG